MIYGNSSKRLRHEDLHVDVTGREAWVSGLDHAPRVGQQVYCTQGLASVSRVLGKTSDGGRLLELRLADTAPPFFAAASNVLVDPTETP
jgi:hypothetical protein